MAPNTVVSVTHETPLDIPQDKILGACRSVSDFEKLNRIGEGTYGIVYRARDLRSGVIVALKKIRMEMEKEGLSICSVREISLLMQLRHKNIVELTEARSLMCCLGGPLPCWLIP